MCTKDFLAIRYRMPRTPPHMFYIYRLISLLKALLGMTQCTCTQTHCLLETLGGSPTGDPPSSPGFSNAPQNDFILFPSLRIPAEKPSSLTPSLISQTQKAFVLPSYLKHLSQIPLAGFSSDFPSRPKSAFTYIKKLCSFPIPIMSFLPNCPRTCG